MTLKRYLAEGDPVAREPELDAFHAQLIRQRVIVEAHTQPSAGPALWWLRPIAVAGAVAACLLIAIGVGMRIDNGGPSPSVAVGRRLESQPPRQMQFASPGGTRIIWTFHQEMDL